MSTRSSPFRRPASPGSPTAYRASTPPSTSRVQASPLSSPSKLKQSYTVSEEEEEESMIVTPTKSNNPISDPQQSSSSMTRLPPEQPASPSTSPTRKLPQPPARTQQQQLQPQQPPPVSIQSISQAPSPRSTTRAPSGGLGDDLSKLPPAVLHSLRESFSVLDSNSTGTITPSSVAETLQSLGLSTNEMAQLFPPGHPQQISLPQYLNSLAAALVHMSPQQELLNAFSAFDDDDSGQIDVAELRRALLTTPPEPGERALSERDIDEALKGFTGRRILGKSGVGLSGLRNLGTQAIGGVSKKSGDVFRYHEFVNNFSGGAAQDSHSQAVGVAAR